MTEVPAEYYNATYSNAVYPVSAKEMNDPLYCEVYNAEGYLVSNECMKTVKDYAMGLLNNASQKDSLKKVIVDMLNYGTEAQKYFKYNDAAEDYANVAITAEQQAQYATGEVEVKNIQVKGENFYGSTLSLADCILLNTLFKKYEEGMTATISFTDYHGEAKSFTVPVGRYSTSTYAKVTVNQIVLGDAGCPVTVTVYKADGSVHGSCVESVESYVARNLTGATAEINMAIMKFATSAKAHLG